MTPYGKEMLVQVVGGYSNVTLLMEKAVTVAEIRICRKGVRLIRSDEVEDALKEAGIEIPEVLADHEEGDVQDDAITMPEVPDWAEVEKGAVVEFKDSQGDMSIGTFAGINDDGFLVVTVTTGDDSFDTAVLPENVRMKLAG